MNQYGPAIVLGVIIGAAILLDDVITPQASPLSTRIKMVEMGEMGEMGEMPLNHGAIHQEIHGEIHKAIHGENATSRPQAATKIWIQEDSSKSMLLGEDIEIAVTTDDSDNEDSVTVVEVKVDASATADLGAKVKAVVEQARKEGRTPSPDELRAAVAEALALGDDSGAVAVEVMTTEKTVEKDIAKEGDR